MEGNLCRAAPLQSDGREDSHKFQLLNYFFPQKIMDLKWNITENEIRSLHKHRPQQNLNICFD